MRLMWKRIRCARCGGHGVYEGFGGGPVECKECSMSGFYWLHHSGLLAQWPGGPALGRMTEAETVKEFKIGG